ncbi:MAG: ABC transporter permease [Bacteroidales bacterium]|nr:ABC transporter permease [Bacteroidales bacterium]
MFERERWREVIHVLSKNKLRTFMTAFGILWGIFMLMIMLGASTGLSNGMKRNLGDFAVNSCFIWAQQTTMPYKGFKKGRHYNFELKDMDMLGKKIPEIEYLSPRMNRGNMPISRDKKTGGFNIFGDFPEFNNIDPMTIVKGRFLNHKDIQDRRKVVVIGERANEVLFEQDEDALGKYIKVNDVYFQVVGIFRSKHTGGWGNYQNQSVIMPLTTLQKTFNEGNTVHWFSITAKRGTSAKYIETKAISLLKAAHYVHPDDEMAVGHQNVEEEFKKFNGLFMGVNIVVWIVGLGTLFAGIIGVSNIMLVVVRERTQEFGIQRAVGATPWKIIGQLIMESVFLTVIAGYIGLFFGIGLVELVDMIISGQHIEAFYNPEVSLEIAFKALAVLVVAGTLAGIIPAKRAVSMKPIDAIRSEYK